MTAPKNPAFIPNLTGSLRKKSETVIFLPLHGKNRKVENMSHCGPPVFGVAWTDNLDMLASSLSRSCLSVSRLLALREDKILISLAIDSNRPASNLVCCCAFQMVARSH
jgi:hypothetical protein